MKIDYVIISSDDNPLYKDFYPIVAKKWNDLGFKVYYINITNIDEIINNEFGVIHRVKKLPFVSSAFQSQVIRLFSCNFINGNLLMSDIDMLPLNADYFNQYLSELTKNNIIIYSGQPYNNVPYYSMCYVLANSELLKKILSIEGISFGDFCNTLITIYGEKWNVDENFMYEKFQFFKENLVIKNRDFSTRIDRSNWNYDVNKLKIGYYVDSHLLRPCNIYINEIKNLL